jgi:hypothetical protein
MKHTLLTLALAGVLATGAAVATRTDSLPQTPPTHSASSGQAGSGQAASVQAPTQTPAPPDPIRELIGHLELEKYKTTLKGLAQFGDRQQGTKRNRDAIDWIEAQLKSYGCTNTERIIYTYDPPARGGGGGRAGQAAAGAGQAGRAGGQAAAGAGQAGRGQARQLHRRSAFLSSQVQETMKLVLLHKS